MERSQYIILFLLIFITVIPTVYFLLNRTGIIILKKELKSIIYSPIAWIIVSLVMLLNGFSFTAALEILRKNDIDETLVGYTFSSTSFWLTYLFTYFQ